MRREALRRTFPKSTTRRPVTAGTRMGAPSLYAVTSSPHKRKDVARMVVPAPPLPAVK